MEAKTPIGAPKLNLSVWVSQPSSMEKTEEERDAVAVLNAQRIFLRNRKVISDYLLPPGTEEMIEYPLHRLATIDVQAVAQYKDRRCRELGATGAYSAREFPSKIRDAMVRDVYVFQQNFEALTTELVRDYVAEGRIAPLEPEEIEIEWTEEDWNEELDAWLGLEPEAPAEEPQPAEEETPEEPQEE